MLHNDQIDDDDDDNVEQDNSMDTVIQTDTATPVINDDKNDPLARFLVHAKMCTEVEKGTTLDASIASHSDVTAAAEVHRPAATPDIQVVKMASQVTTTGAAVSAAAATDTTKQMTSSHAATAAAASTAVASAERARTDAQVQVTSATLKIPKSFSLDSL